MPAQTTLGWFCSGCRDGLRSTSEIASCEDLKMQFYGERKQEGGRFLIALMCNRRVALKFSNKWQMYLW